MQGESSDRTEPVWFTTANLIALVIGCSMALAMPWHNSPTAQIGFAGGLMSRSFALQCMSSYGAPRVKPCCHFFGFQTPMFPTRGGWAGQLSPGRDSGCLNSFAVHPTVRRSTCFGPTPTSVASR